MAWNNNNNNTRNNDYNLCVNWGLRCFEMKQTDKAVILKCSMSKKDKQTGEYSAPLYMDVYCAFDTCDIKEDDYTKSSINVDGQISISTYTTKGGEARPNITIFATRVTKR